ncbi:MAG: hypothetical protein LBR46_03505 [Prevotella sp.]|jgi:hypothetical protein|nr:hypothetical protein [Prevotella sp.]
MRKLQFYILALLLLFFPILIEGQNSVNVDIYPERTITLNYEKFNLNTFSSKFAQSGSLDYTYTEADGTQIRVTCQRIGEPIEVYEIPPSPAVHRLYKEFYPDGNMKQKGLYLPQQFPIGKWLECDRNGRCRVVDQDMERGSVNYNDMLKILERYNFLNGPDNWQVFVVWYNDIAHQWGAKLRKGTEYKTLTIDANSGKVSNEFGYEISMPNIEVNREYFQSE